MDELGFFERPGSPARLPRRPAAARRARGDRHRHAPRAGDPDRPAVPPGRAVDAGARPRVPAGQRRHRRRAVSRARSSATSACPARPSATSSASGCGWPAGTRPGGAAATRFDLKAWHMAALSQGSLGLDDLVRASWRRSEPGQRAPGTNEITRSPGDACRRRSSVATVQPPAAAGRRTAGSGGRLGRRVRRPASRCRLSAPHRARVARSGRRSPGLGSRSRRACSASSTSWWPLAGVQDRDLEDARPDRRSDE